MSRLLLIAMVVAVGAVGVDRCDSGEDADFPRHYKPIPNAAECDTQRKVGERTTAWLNERVIGRWAEANRGKPWAEAGRAVIVAWCGRFVMPSDGPLPGLAEVLKHPCADPTLQWLAGRDGVDPATVERLWLAAGKADVVPPDVLTERGLKMLQALLHAGAPPADLRRLQDEVIACAQRTCGEPGEMPERRAIAVSWQSTRAEELRAIQAKRLEQGTLERLMAWLDDPKRAPPAHAAGGRPQLGAAIPWVADTLRGSVDTGFGWEARGIGDYSTITPEGWKVFQAHLARAKGELERAWAAEPKRPEAAAFMITVTLALHGDETKRNQPACRAWFDRAVSAQMDYGRAYDAMLGAFDLMWGGTIYEMSEFGTDCLRTERYDTRVPLVFFDALARIGRVSEIPANAKTMAQTRREMWSETTWTNAQRVWHQSTDQADPAQQPTWGSRELPWLESRVAAIAVLCGHRDVAAPIIRRLGQRVDRAYFTQLRLDPDAIRADGSGAAASAAGGTAGPDGTDAGADGSGRANDF